MKALILRARAGTGKTTSIVEGLREILTGSARIEPSAQQRAFWDAIPKTSSYCCVSFNKSIASELQNRVPAGVDSCTLHSLGLKAVIAAFGSRGSKIDGERTTRLLERFTDVDALIRENPVALGTIKRLVSLCKTSLRDPDPDELQFLIQEYDLEVDGRWTLIRQVVPQILELARTNTGTIDFDDMIWLPVVRKLPVKRYGCLIVDEAQDLNPLQHAFTRRVSDNLVYVGDDRQAIYGFAGADTGSLGRIERELKAEVLPLTETRRCGARIVAEANQIVPDLTAHPCTGEGEVLGKTVDDLLEQAVSGDFVICRTNAPLVSVCLGLIGRGKKATVQGRDIGDGLVTLIRKLKATSVVSLIEKVSAWRVAEIEKELAKKLPRESKIVQIQDKETCIEIFCEGASSVNEVISRIKQVFVDDAPGIRCSSIHRSKGLEADTVWFYQPPEATCPHARAGNCDQEWNLRYVAITRAKKRLIHTYSPKKKKQG